jgi:hypothetical protein
MSRTGQFIYLKTRGCLEVDEKTREVHSFVCVNSLVSDEEGRRLIREMKKKFSAIISEQELSAMESKMPGVENPQKLERAILNLITNLNNPASYDDDNISLKSDSTNDTEDSRRTKTPPLNIVAPKTGIKPSILRAVSVVGQASKGRSPPSIKDEPKSPETPNLQAPETCHDPTAPLKIKIESTTQNILSPTCSSMSSIDSDTSSPFLINNNHNQNVVAKSENIYTNDGQQQTTPTVLQDNASEYYNDSYDNLPVYGNNTMSVSTNDSISIASNNNNSNNNRNSVLKRTYTIDNEDDDDYVDMIKKPALSDDLPSDVQIVSNTPLDLLATSDSGK